MAGKRRNDLGGKTKIQETGVLERTTGGRSNPKRGQGEKMKYPEGGNQNGDPARGGGEWGGAAKLFHKDGRGSPGRKEEFKGR